MGERNVSGGRGEACREGGRLPVTGMAGESEREGIG